MSETVDEDTGRAAVDAAVKAYVDLQRELGVPVPSQAKAEELGRPVAIQQIKVHEENKEREYWLPSHLSEKDPSQPKAAIDRGEVGDNTVPVNSIIADASFNKSTGLLKCDPNTIWRQVKPKEDVLLRERLDMLGQLPEWKDKLEKAAFEAESVWRKRDWLRGDMKALNSMVADSVIEVVETANKLFGDWRFPAPPVAGTLIFGP